MRVLGVLIYVIFFSLNIKSQIVLIGTVNDESKTPLIGATILDLDTGEGTVCDVEGKFTLSTKVGNKLRFSYVGMKDLDIVVSQNNIEIMLRASSLILDDVVVVGYGVQKRRDVTGAVSTISEKVLESRPAANLINSLQGAVAGLQVNIIGSNAEGSNFTTRLRGTNSITASNVPLIILDGVPYNGSFSEINPNDVQSMEVLKDASSTAIYGSRGANGVILIQTKRAKKDEKFSINYDGNIVISEAINIPKMMDGLTFYNRKKEAGGDFTLTENEMFAAGGSTNWVDLILRRGMNQNHNLSMRGASASTRYFLSGNYSHNKGIAINDLFQRTTFRINFEQDVNKYITLGTNSQFGHFDRSGKEANFDDAFLMNPLGRPYDDSGNLRLQVWEDAVYGRNPLSSLNEINADLNKTIFSNNYLQIKLPVEGLNYKLNTGYTYEISNVKNYWGRNTFEGNQSNGRLNIFNRTATDWLIENILSYNKNIGKNNFFVTGLYSAQSTASERSTIDASNFPNDVLTYYQPDKGSVLTATSGYTQTNNLSSMARLNYNYDSKYLLTATIRRDGFSAFGDDKKHGVFPSLAVGWNISNENFIKNSKVGEIFNTLKLRASWGKNGNQAISAYASLPNLRSLNYLSDDYRPQFGFFPSRLASPFLGWETTTSANFGLDYGLFGDRINGSIEYYNSKTTDLLLSRSIPTINGTSSIIENIGATSGHGFEFQISATNFKSKNFTWATDFNFVTNQSIIENVGLFDADGKPIDDLASGWFIGQPVSVNFDYIFDGIYQKGEVPPDAPFNSQPGYIRYKDLNNDGKITPQDDRRIIGSRLPTFTSGIGNTIKYGNLSLFAFVNVSYGITRPNFLFSSHTISYRQNQIERDFWSEANPINTFHANDPNGSSNPLRMRFYEKTDFIRLQDVSLSYNLPTTFMNKFGISKFEIYSNVKNLLTLTKWSGLDPEFVTLSERQRAIPQTRQFLTGIRVKF